MPISSDRGGVNTAPIATIADAPITPAVNDFMSAFQQGFITVNDLVKRGAALPAEVEGSRQNLQDQIQIRPLQRQQAVGQISADLALQPRKQTLQSGQLDAAITALPTPTETEASGAAREKTAQLQNALSSSVPGVREKAIANLSTEQVIDTWTAAHGQPPPETIEAPGGGVEPKSIDLWVTETYGQDVLAGDAQAVLTRPDVVQGYSAYVKEAQNRPMKYFKGDPQYIKALQNDLLTAKFETGIQEAKLKALPGMLEKQAESVAGGPARAAKAEDELLSQSTPRLKQFREQTEAYEKISGLRNKPVPTNADDLALIYSYIKLLDPGSVVRESEIILAQKATPLTDRLVQQYRNLYSNRRGVLDPRTRLDYLDTSETLYEGVKRATTPEVQRLASSAESRGANLQNILTSSERGLLNGSATTPGGNAPSAGAKRVVQDGVTFEWDGTRYVPVQ